MKGVNWGLQTIPSTVQQGKAIILKNKYIPGRRKFWLLEANRHATSSWRTFSRQVKKGQRHSKAKAHL